MTRTRFPRLFVPLAAAALGLLALAAACPSQADGLTLHTARCAMPAVTIGSSIYVIGGFEPQGYASDIERINLVTGRLQDIPTSLRPRGWHSAVADGPYIYVLGGGLGLDPKMGLTNAVERYDTRSGHVSQMTPLPTPRHLAASVLSGGRIYVIGGSASSGQETGVVEIYDIKTNTWTTGAPMPTPRECPLTVRDGVIYALGGYDGSNAAAAAEAYDIASNAWHKLPDLPAALSAHHMALDGDRLYTFGDYQKMDLVGVYSLKSGIWRPLSDTGYAPSRHNAVVTAGGKVYVIGGNTASSTAAFLKTVQVFSLAALASL